MGSFLTKNIKWLFVSYFLFSSFIMLGASYIGWFYYSDLLMRSNLWLVFISLLLLISISIGYMVAQRFQRKLDTLHTGILQLKKVNLSVRLPVLERDAFELLFQDFNAMTSSLEERIKLLQALGEENVLLQSKTNEEAVLEERKRLASDLHDTVSQQLFAIHMASSSLAKIIAVDREQAEQLIQHLTEMSYTAQRQMRALIAKLRPLELAGKSISEALDQWFPDYCRQSGLHGSLDIQLQSELSEAKEVQLFLIVQEAMANIVKHAAAKHVSLTLIETESQFSLRIEDDGQGFNTEERKQGTYGLSTIQERTMKLGGDVEILSNKGQGTRIQVRIPKFQ